MPSYQGTTPIPTKVFKTPDVRLTERILKFSAISIVVLYAKIDRTCSNKDSFALVSRALTVEEIQKHTGCHFNVSPHLKVIQYAGGDI